MGYRCIVENDKVTKVYRIKLVTLKFSMDSIPTGSGEHMANEILRHWLQAYEKGQWCKEHCVNLETIKEPEFHTMMYRVAIIGELYEKDYTFYALKWSDRDNDVEIFPKFR